MNTFADRLKSAMRSAGMNQKMLAEACGLARSTISEYLSGKITPRIEHMRTLAEVTGVPLDYLTGVTAPPAARVVPAKKINVKDAARCMGKSRGFVLDALAQGRLTFGVAIPPEETDRGRWEYHISPALFRAYIGAEQFDQYFQMEADHATAQN